MTVRDLIDTDWVIHYLNGRDDIVRRLDELQPAGLGLSVISLAELYEGIYYSTDPQGNEQALNDFLRGVQVIGIDEDACKIFGRESGSVPDLLTWGLDRKCEFIAIHEESKDNIMHHD